MRRDVPAAVEPRGHRQGEPYPTGSLAERPGGGQGTDEESGYMADLRSGLVIQPTIGRDDAEDVCGLLREIRLAAGTPSDLADAAGFWSSQVSPEMERGDLQTVAWLLRDASSSRRLPTPLRDRARYWAAYLEGRLFR
jgi:hypothetical protein